jgi:hypothetical protein
MRIPARFAAPLGAVLLAACAGSNPYHSLAGGEGYSDVALAPDRWQISFHGSPDQDETAAKKYALVRAAQIAVAHGYPYIRLEEGETRVGEDRQRVRETEAVRERDYPGLYPGGRRVRARSVTRTESRPAVKVVVAMEKEACAECLAAGELLREARSSGILGK